MLKLRLRAPTREDQARVKRMTPTDPGQMLRLLEPSLQSEESSADAYAVLLMIAQTINGKNEGSSADIARWETLVRVGVVDQLCRLIEAVDIEVDSASLPGLLVDSVQDSQTSSNRDMPTSYQLPLEILCTVLNPNHLNTPTDRKVVSTTKKHLPTISQRIWNDPSISLQSSGASASLRTLYPRICLALVTSDPMVLTSIYNPEDWTIPILARQWKHCVAEPDIKSNTIALEQLLNPQQSGFTSYTRQRGIPASELLLSRLYLGVGPKTTSTRATQSGAFVSAAAKHMLVSTDVARHALNFVLQICHLSLEANELSIYRALRSSGAIWSACISLLRKPLPEQITHADAGLVDFILGLMMNTIHDAQFSAPEERGPLIKLWIEQGFFDALDKNIEQFVKMPYAHKHITLISSAISGSLEALSPTLITKLQAQFPRWRTAGTLVRFDVMSQGATGGAPEWPLDGTIPPPDHPAWHHASWQTFGTMQLTYFDYDLCGRRTCGKPGSIDCENCKEVKYCSENCQTKDAAAHGCACGLMFFVKNKMQEETVAEVAPTPPVLQNNLDALL